MEKTTRDMCAWPCSAPVGSVITAPMAGCKCYQNAWVPDKCRLCFLLNIPETREGPISWLLHCSDLHVIEGTEEGECHQLYANPVPARTQGARTSTD